MMPRKQRAKQFLPFDSMKGLKEALALREEIHSRVEKHGISEEQQAEINKTLCKIEKGCKVFISYYAAFHDREKEGIITCINRPYQFLRIDEEKIDFSDLYDIHVVG